MSSNEFDSNTLNYLLPVYYKKLFPHGPYFKWLSYGSGKYLLIRLQGYK